MKFHTFMLASAFTAFSSTALAQQAAAGPATPVTIPAMTCENPGEGAGIEPSYAQVQRFQKRIDAYKSCVNDYAKAMGAKASEYADVAKTYTNAGNAAIESYNAYVTGLNAKQKSADGGDARPAPSSANTDKPKY